MKDRENDREMQSSISQLVRIAHVGSRHTALHLSLDPTQRAVHDRVLRWAEHVRSGISAVAPCRLLMLGTAGTGKSDTIRAIAQSVENALGHGAVLRAAHTGVAAFNIGDGAETINSIFRLGQRLGEELIHVLGAARLIVLDEISMVGSEQFYEVSDRMEEVVRLQWRRTHGRHRRTLPDGRLDGEPSSFGGFGGAAVILVGDFGQLPPIGDPSLIQPGKGQSRKAAAGQRLFKTFTEVVRLRRVYRQRGKSLFKDSTLRLRDVALTFDDHALWQTHDLAGALAAPKAAEDVAVKRTLEEEALWLVTENKLAGARNGEELVWLAETVDGGVGRYATGWLVGPAAGCPCLHVESARSRRERYN